MTTLLEIALSNAVVATILALIVLCLSCVCRRPALIHFLWISTASRITVILLATCLLPLWPAIGQDEQGNVTDAKLESASAKKRDANDNFRGVAPTSIEPTVFFWKTHQTSNGARLFRLTERSWQRAAVIEPVAE